MYSQLTTYRVCYADTDQMQYMYYGNYARLYEIGRVEAMRALGFSYKAFEEQGICELAANDDMLAKRQQRGSKAFRLMAEAHNIQKGQNSDSDLSGSDSSAHDSDLEFID